jgi:aminoglycoside phosphotransferase (APT) family kinase protein
VSEEHDVVIAAGTPAADVAVDEDLVTRLLTSQHPDLAGLPRRFVANGWDNVTYRLGEELAVRLPRRQSAVELVVHEQRWLPELARRVAVAVPEPVRVGGPGEGYPYPWTVVRWVPGVPADIEPLAPVAAPALGSFLADLHGPAPEDAPRNPHRGIPLRVKEPAVVPRLDRLALREVVAPEVLEHARVVWADAVEAPIDRDPSWLHSDLHAKNVVGRDGRLVGVIDWGDLGVGDPATDLAAAWMHFPAEAHADVWAAYGEVSDATLRRARGWAVFFGAVFLDTVTEDGDTFGPMARTTLERIAAERADG